MAYSYYDANWTVLQKLQYLQELVQTNCADVSSVNITSEQSGTTVTVTISFTNYEGTTVTHTITYEVTEPEDPDYITSIAVQDDGTLLFTFYSGKTITADGQVVPTITVGTTTSGTTASVTNSGTSLNAIFDFVLPTTQQEITTDEINSRISGTYGIVTEESSDGSTVEIHFDTPKKLIYLSTKSLYDIMDGGSAVVVQSAVFLGDMFVIVDADTTALDSGNFYLSDIAGYISDGTIESYGILNASYSTIVSTGSSNQLSIIPATMQYANGEFLMWVGSSASSSTDGSVPSLSYSDYYSLSPKYSVIVSGVS